MRDPDAYKYVYEYPSSDRPAYVIRGAYIYEYPHGPAVFVSLNGVWYDCTAPFEARFQARAGRVYDLGTGRVRYHAVREPVALRVAAPVVPRRQALRAGTALAPVSH